MKLRAAKSLASGRIARAALVVATLTLTACGGDDPQPSSSAGPAPGATTSRPSSASPARSPAGSTSPTPYSVTVRQDDPAGAESADGVLLRVVLQPGQTYRLIRESTAESAAMGMTQKQDAANTYLFEVLEVDDQGVHRIKVTYDAIRMSITGGPQRINYDSTDPRRSRPSDPIALVMNPLIGQSFEMHLSDRGQILQVTGMPAIVQKVSAEAGQIGELLGPQLTGQMSDEAVASVMQSMIPVFPEHPVAPGGIWSTGFVLMESNMTLRYDTRYTLETAENGQVTLGVETAFATPPGTPPVNIGPMTMAMDVAGSMSGWLVVDQVIGWPLLASSDLAMQGSASIEAEGLPEPMNSPLQMTGTTKVINPIE